MAEGVNIPVQVTVTAVDSSKNAFKGISSNLANLTSGLKSSTSTMGGLTMSVGDMAKGFFLGGAALMAAKKALEFVVDQTKQMITSAMDSEQAWQQVIQNVNNAGFAFADVGKKIQDVAKANMALGFSDEDTAKSISRLMLATQDLNKAVEINQIAMDLARFKGVDLETATNALTKAYTGNKMLLKQLGIEVDEVANREQTLHFVNQQVEGSSKRFAETTKGQFTVMSEGIREFKEQLGFALLPTINYVIETIGEMAPAFEFVGNIVMTVVRAISSELLGIATVVRTVIEIIGGMFNAVKAGGERLFKGDLVGAAQAFGAEASRTVGAVKNTWTSASAKLGQVWGGSMIDMKNDTKKMADAVGDGITQKAKEIGKQLEKENQDFARDIERMTKNFESSLKDLIIAHRDKTNKLKADIQEENQDFKESEDERKEDFDETLSEMKDSHEEKVADIQDQIDDETAKGLSADQERLNDLKIELDKEEKEYAKSVAKKTKEFEKETAKAKEEHDKRLKSLQDELNAEMELQKKYADDFAKFKDAVAEDDIARLKRTFAEEMAERARQHTERLAQLNEQVKQEIAVRDAANARNQQSVSQTISQAQSTAQQAKVSSQGFVSGFVAGKSGGGGGGGGGGSWQKGGVIPASRGKPVLAVVHGGERIEPALGSEEAGGTSITFNFEGVFLGSQTEMREFALKIWEHVGQIAKAQNKSPDELLSLKV